MRTPEPSCRLADPTASRGKQCGSGKVSLDGFLGRGFYCQQTWGLSPGVQPGSGRRQHPWLLQSPGSPGLSTFLGVRRGIISEAGPQGPRRRLLAGTRPRRCICSSQKTGRRVAPASLGRALSWEGWLRRPRCPTAAGSTVSHGCGARGVPRLGRADDQARAGC